MLTILSVLSKWEMLTLFIISVGVFFLGLDLIKRITKKIRKKKMLQEYLNLKNEKWNELIGVLADKENLDIIEIQTRMGFDFSVFDRKYKDIIYHEVIKIRNENEINPWNLKVLTRKLIN